MYKITISPAKEGRLVRNLGGSLVVFRDGVGYTSSRVAASIAERLKFEVEEITPAQPEIKSEETEGKDTDPEVDVHALKEELGTWTKVAEHLGITTAQLKKLRDEA